MTRFRHSQSIRLFILLLILLFISVSYSIWTDGTKEVAAQSVPDSDPTHIYLPLIENVEGQVTAADVQPPENLTYDDSYWAALAQNYPPFSVNTQSIQATSPSNVGGEWGNLISWPHVPVSAAHLPDGRILTWASNDRDSFPSNQPEQTYTATWDPQTGQFQEFFHNSHDMFCASQGMLEDGRLFVNGGRNFGDSPWTSIFDYRTNTWTKLENMHKGRWYPTSLVMPGDKVFTALGTGGDQYPELWEPGESWTLQTGINLTGPVLNYTGHYENLWWPYLSLASDGRLLHAGPTPRMHWINPLGNGTIQQTGPEITDWYPKHAGVVLYDEAKLLMAGGAMSGGVFTATNKSMTIDLSGGTPQVTTIPPMQFARKFHNAVTLPNGEVLVVGGNTSGIKFSDAGTILTPEIWNPQINSWRSMNDMASPRNYHSIAMLLQDGRVLSAGGGLCGCAADHQDGQVFSPPYLFDANGTPATRPAITNAPTTASVGEQISVQATAGLQGFNLIKLSSTTHAVDTDQRFLPLPFSESPAGQYQLTLHHNVNVMTPGYWMLFGLDSQGVPSVASVIQIETDISASQVGAIGHNGGSEFDLKCSAGEALVGITGRADASIQEVGPLCASVANDGTWSGVPSNPATTGGTGGTPFTRTCPTDYAVTGFSGRADTKVEQLELTCQPLTTDGYVSGPGQSVGSVGGAGGNPVPLNSCSYDLPGSGIFGRSGADIDAFGLHCRRLEIGNAPPSISDPGTQISIIGDQINLGISATDPEGAPLSYSALGLPTGLAIDLSSGIISGTLPTGSNSEYVVTISVSDGEDTTDVVFTWIVYLDGLGTGQILREWWSNITGNTVAALTGSPDFPANPTGTEYLSAFQAPSSWDDYYGNRIRGYIHPPISGSYQLAIASDDRSELWLSTDDTAANKVLIASVPGYTSSQNWSKYPEQTAFVTLQAGQKYYIEALHKEGVLGDHLAVGWQIPGGSLQVISGQYLSPYQLTNVALGQPASQSSTFSAPYSFDAANAVDGNIDGAQENNSISHTNADAEAWWEVDLGAFYNLDTIRIWNRTDCCEGNLSDFHVLVSDGPFTSQNLGRTITQPGVSDFHFSGTAGRTTNIVLDRTGRYIRIQLSGTNHLHLAEVQIFASGLSFLNHPPTISPLPDQVNLQGDTVALTISATDIDDDPLIYDAVGLPDGLSIHQISGQITGTPTVDGLFTPVISVGDGKNGSDSISFNWTITPASPIIIGQIDTMPEPVTTLISYTAIASGGNGLQYRWLFGDGTPETTESTNPTIQHTYNTPGRYIVQVTVVDAAGQSESHQFYQAIHEVHTANRPNSSTTIVYEERTGNARIWNVNPDNNSVSLFDTVTNLKVTEIVVDEEPYSLAIAPDGRIWVSNHESATISIIDPSTLAIVQTVNLPPHSSPFGLVFSPTGNAAYVALEETGQLLKLNPTSGIQIDSVDVGANPRQLSISADGSNVLVSRFITPLLPGEEGSSPQTEINGVKYGGEVLIIDSTSMIVSQVIILEHSNRLDAEHTGRGIPNYLGAPLISPGGFSAWVPSKQDNILSGTLRDSIPLDFDHTVRSVTSRIDLISNNEDIGGRVDHDNAGVANAALFDPYGNYLFVALETNREVAVVDAYAANSELFRFPVERAPQGLARSTDGMTLYVHNFMERSVTVHDITSLVEGGNFSVNLVATYDTVANEALSPQILTGKQLFYDAIDSRLSLDSYMSCASCHNDGGHDGRVWDFTHLGEGLRNTISLEGHAGVGQGRLHWSANFDEVHDFENQIRNFAGGTGLMSNGDFQTGTRSDPLGDPKAGISSDLDALAAYVTSLATFGESPYRTSGGLLTGDGLAGKAIFQSANCTACHLGVGFTDSNQNILHDIGTIKPSSGNRAGGLLSGIDTPTLRGLWATAPYLHDGSAPTLADAVTAHNGVSLTTGELNQLVAYLKQIDDNEPAPSINIPPVITNPGNQSNTLNDTVDLIISASDADLDPLTFGATGLPVGLSIGVNSGQISGTVTITGTYPVTITVDDGRGGSDAASFIWSVDPPANIPPIISNPGNQSNILNDVVDLTVSASDADLDPLTFGATGLPTGLSVGVNSGQISGTVAITGTYPVTVTVNDGRGGADSASFVWTVNAPANIPPVIVNPGNQNNTLNDTVDLTISASDADLDPLTFGATGLPTGLSIGANSGQISGTVTITGTYPVTVTVDDGRGGSDAASFVWTVNAPANIPPVIVNPGNQSNILNDVVDLTISASDADSDPLTFGATGLPVGLSIGVNSGQISGTVTITGTYPVTVTVTDGRGGSDAASFVWTVDPPANIPPVVINPGNQSNILNDVVDLTVSASDGDLDPLTFGATGLPAGLSIGVNSGQISGTVTITGTYPVTVTVNDGRGGSDAASFIWTVDPPANIPPVINNPGNQNNILNDTVDLTVSASDADLDPLTFGATGLPAGLSIGVSSGQISGTVTITGTYSVTVTVDDGRGGTDVTSFIWTVNAPANVPPVINSPGNQSNILNDTVDLTISASDADLDPLTFGATGLPTGLSIGVNSGQISGTVTITGTYPVTVTVDDGRGGSDAASFAWTVNAPANIPPIISNPGNQSNIINDVVDLTVSASDADLDPLTFGATGLPAGLSIGINSGQISGTVTITGTYPVTVTVDDGRGGSDAASFVWTVAPPANVPPVISSPGNQNNILNDTVDLTVSASDADLDPLTFGATGLPAG
ncbi:MAG: putative Ig domain-containing protein, partial [Chloroflexota bacterium]